MAKHGATPKDSVPSGSFRRIDYRVRPAKQIERRLIAEALQQLVRSVPWSGRYSYVGMGSIAFVDFVMIHRALGVARMVSIEKEEFADRAEFNRPYNCIKVERGDVNDVLPRIDLGERSIIWLDYDGKLKESMFADAGVCATRSGLGSVLLITVNADSGLKPVDEFKRLGTKVAKLRIAGLTHQALQGMSYAETVRGMFNAEFEMKLSAFNKGRPDHEKRRADQFLYFCYKDGARMVTLGWIFDSMTESLVTSTKLANLSTYRPADTPFVIDPPVLTPAEARELNRQLPAKSGEVLSCIGVDSTDVDAYAELYRHFPLYFEVAEA